VHEAVHLLSLLDHESGLTLAPLAVANGGAQTTGEHNSSLRAVAEAGQLLKK
jgi:hypothetical protein